MTTNTEYVKGSEVLNQCYANFIGVRVTNRESNAWAGSIRFSLDNGVSYSAMSCQDCTGVGTTEYIVVEVCKGSCTQQKEERMIYTTRTDK